MIVCASYFNKKMKAAFRESRVQIGELNSQVEDSLLGVRVVKSFANENLEIEKAISIIEDLGFDCFTKD